MDVKNEMKIRLYEIGRDYQEMRSMDLLTNEERRTIHKDRKELAIKLDTSNSIDDYKACLALEKNVYEKVKKRKSRSIEKTSELELRLFRNLVDLYEKTMRQFPAEKRIYFDFHSFCIANKIHDRSDAVCRAMIEKFPDDEEVLMKAAEWYVHDRKDYEKAIVFLRECIDKNKNFKRLYFQCMKYEVENAILTTSVFKSEATDKQIEELVGRLRVNVNAMIEARINDCNHYTDVLIWLEDYDYSLEVQGEIVGHVLKAFSDDAFCWDFIARRERRGFNYEACDGKPRISKCQIREEKVQKCIDKYEYGTTKVSEMNAPILWDLYMECLLELKDELGGRGNKELMKIITIAFNSASKHADVTEQGYLAWLELLNDDPTQLGSILKTATAKLPKSVILWKLRLENKIETASTNVEAVRIVFSEGVAALQADALPIWIIMLQFSILSYAPTKLEQLYADAIEQPSPISDVFKVKYLEYLSLSGKMNKCRKLYFMWATKEPYNKELYTTMCKLSSSQSLVGCDVWQRILTLGIEQFGKEDDAVWLEYIHFCLLYKPEVVIDDIKQMALDSLPCVLHSRFEENCIKLSRSIPPNVSK